MNTTQPPALSGPHVDLRLRRLSDALHEAWTYVCQLENACEALGESTSDSFVDAIESLWAAQAVEHSLARHLKDELIDTGMSVANIDISTMPARIAQLQEARGEKKSRQLAAMKDSLCKHADAIRKLHDLIATEFKMLQARARPPQQ